MKTKLLYTYLLIITSCLYATCANAQEDKEALPEMQVSESTLVNDELEDDIQETVQSNTIFDDKMLLAGYAKKYKNLSKNILLEMIKDEYLTSYKSAAAIRVFRENFASDIFAREKRIDEKILLRRLNRTTSPFVEVETMHTLCIMDRYRYFKSMVPALLQKLDHYNSTVNELAFLALTDIIETGSKKTREARIIFNTLRKMLFLSRKKLENITNPGPKLERKLKILKWSIKVLGSDEIKRLPKEVLNLL